MSRSIIHYVHDGWYPTNLSEAQDMTAGGYSSLGGASYSDGALWTPNSADWRQYKTFTDDTGEKWWSTDTNATTNWNSWKVSTKEKVYIKRTGKSNYNTLIIMGATGKDDPESPYVSSTKKGAWIKDVMGFSMVWNIVGSYSTGGGSAQAYPEKVGMIYADPYAAGANHRKRVLVAGTKIRGSSLTSQGDQNDKYSAYAVDTEGGPKWRKIQNEGWLWAGAIIQFYHGSKSSSRDTQANIGYFRPLVCSGNMWGRKTRGLIYGDPIVWKASEAAGGNRAGTNPYPIPFA